MSEEQRYRSTTRSKLTAVASIAAGWIAAQMQLPPSFMRSHYRKRSNPRYLVAGNAGGIYKACDIGSRWHLFAFYLTDLNALINVTQDKPNVFSLRIGNELRTEVKSWLGKNATAKVDGRLQHGIQDLHRERLRLDSWRDLRSLWTLRWPRAA